MRFSILVAVIAFTTATHSAAGQELTPSALRQLEKEMLARISERAVANGGFRFGAGEFDLRLPLRGEPEEIVGPTLNAAGALAVGSARVEPLDSIVSRDATYNRARYDLRLEDRSGNCLVVHQNVTFDSALVSGRRTAERCQPLYMAEVIRRARRIARVPFTAGRLDDHWSAALSATGTADVYVDSVVITTTAMTLRASYPVPATANVAIDSISAGLALGEKSWSVVHRSAALAVDTTLRKGGEWRRQVKRFMVPIDSSFALAKSWPVFEVHLSVPKTTDNPLGVAWTYAHERKGFFQQLPATQRPATPRPAVTAQPTRVVGYLASWGVRSKGTRIAQLPAKDLTHIFYAFGKVGNDGRVALGDPCVDIGVCASGSPVDSGGNFAELQRLKARNRHLKLLVSIGGWTGSGKFSDAALTDASRRLFAESAIDVFIRQRPGLFDGIDIDWEFPVAGGMKGNVERPADKANFTLLLAELRRRLDAQGAIDRRHYELAIAASARPSEIANLEIARIVPLLDFINVMTYDYHSGSRRTGFNSPLYAATGDPTPGLNVDVTMRAFLNAGVPGSKLLVGIPFYGRAYGGVPNVNRGLFQTTSGRPENWRERDGDWNVLSRTRLKDPKYVRHWESSARVPWLYDSTSGTWVSYDDPQSVREKVRYVRERGLGGVVIWELGGDDGSLMRAISAK